MTEAVARLKSFIERNPWKICGFFAALVTLVISIHPLLSPDVFMYVAIADRWLLRGIPTQDPFIIDPTAPFQIMHEWLSYFVFWGVHQLSGFDGAIFFKSALFAIMSLIVTKFAARSRTHWLVYASALGLALTSAHFRMSERTSLFSDVFQLGCLYFAILLFSGETIRFKRALIGTFLLFALWTNLHAGWLFGLILVSAGVAARALRSRGDRKWLALPLAAAAGLLVHPEGIYGVLYPFRFSGALRDMYSMYYVEWAPIYVDLLLNFIEVKVFLGFSAFFSVAVVVMGFRRSLFEGAFLLFLVALLVGPTYMHSRFVVVSSFGLAMLACYAFREFPAPSWKGVATSSGVALATAIFFIAWPVKNEASPVKLGIDGTLMPTTALEELGKLPEGNVFNSHEFGGAIAWRFQGRYKVVFHGFDTDPARFLNDYFPTFENEAACLRAIQKYRIQYFFLDRHGGASTIWKMLEKHGWSIKAYDSAAVLLTPPAN